MDWYVHRDLPMTKGKNFSMTLMPNWRNWPAESLNGDWEMMGLCLKIAKKQVKELGLEKDVIFTGFRKDIKNLIYGCDLYINSSEHEALSFAIIEVLACGIPVIATDMAGNGDIINDETKCGILVEYNSPMGLAQAINRIMADRELQEELGKNALKAVKEKFNLDKVAAETYNLYMESCSKVIQKNRYRSV